MVIKEHFLLFFLTLISAALLVFSCSEEKIPSEELYFQALEQSAAGNWKGAVSFLSECLENQDEWGSVAAEQILELQSAHPFLEIPRETIKTAREYHPIQTSSLRSKKEYGLTFSAYSLSCFSAQLLDDVGSSWITGNIDKHEAADRMAEAVTLKRETSRPKDYAAEKWTLEFYAGRLYEKNGPSTYDKALSYYNAARTDAYSELSHDRPLWYFLELNRKTDPVNTASLLVKYSATWNDPEYFDDFLDRLASDLLSKYEWALFYRVYCENSSFFSNASREKYAVISARLIESGLCPAGDIDAVSFPEKSVSVSSAQQPLEDVITQLYETALSHAVEGSYYNLIARFKTGKPFPETESGALLITDELPSPEPIISEGTAPDISEEDAQSSFTEQLLGKYIDHDFADYAYRVLREYSPSLSSGIIQRTYSYLLTKADSETKYLSLTSLALQTVRTRPADTELLKLAYPVYYRTYVEAEARRYGLEPWLLFALIHSESGFQADITSNAGAHGLTQLMSTTAGDVARKLKMTDYNLEDASTNIRFGSFYLSELIGRLDGDILLALFSYNAGITRVRNWKKQAPDLPPEIFLETVPYEETRLYGQKITRAAVMYAALYYEEDYTDVMEHIIHIH